MNIYTFAYKKPGSGKLKIVRVREKTEREALKSTPYRLTSDGRYIMYGLSSVEKE